ncbi:MAG: DNA2/NAM7 family helicase [Rhodospirillales bacterium]|nr:DNA2/NAM7 family helicase [Rhodospirillales bacterium]
MKKWKLRKLLQTYATSGRAEPGADLPALEEARKQLAILDGSPLAGTAGQARSLDRLKRRVAQAISLRDTLAGAQRDVSDSVAFGAVAAALEAGPGRELRQAMEDWQTADKALNAALTQFKASGGRVAAELSLRDLREAVDWTLSQRKRLKDWTDWVALRKEADAAGLSPLADAMENGDLQGDPVDECRRAYARWWLPLAMDASEPLRRFAYWKHEDIVAAFRNLDDKAAEKAPREVMRRIRHRLPARDAAPRKSELGVLRHQLALQRPSMAIRPLLENLGGVLPKLAPCILISPLSIAQYLPAGQARFDVVIFDEASQIATWNAIGAIARAKQSIIVGDPQQLPPTNFFGRSDEEGEDGGMDATLHDMPSILDEVTAAGISTRRLRWHYRSRDEALIAFSNHYYYGDGLVTFPAPSTGSKAVQFHKIDGTYARGAERTNADEAKAIVETIRRRLTAWLEQTEGDRPTLGVVTFNTQQQGLILDLLDKMRRDNPALEWFFAEEREEPVIVKNLENIQGDERDVMLFSITFAPDPTGKLSMNFGALNADGGEKRLNVAITRARRELRQYLLAPPLIGCHHTRAARTAYLCVADP